MSKYLSGIYGQTFSSGGPQPANPTIPVSNFVYGNQFIQGVIQLTADTKASLQSAYGASGVYIGMDTAGTYAGIKLLGPTNASNGSYIDFTTASVAYKGRILYDNNANTMQFYTNAAGSAAMMISATGGLNITSTTDATSATNGGVLTIGGGAAVAKQLYVGSGAFVTGNVGIGTTTTNGSLQFSNSLINRKIVLYEGSNSDNDYCGFGINNATIRYQCLAVGSYHVFYAGVNSTTSVELFRIAGTGIISAPATITSTSSTTGSLLLSGGIGISNTTDATSVVNGGTFTSAGGGAFAKSLWLGGAMNASGLSLTNSQTGGAIVIARMLATSMNAGSDIEMQFGQSTGSLNAGIIQFNYINPNSGGINGNNVSIGFFGNNNVLRVYSDTVKINGNLITNSFSVSGTFSATNLAGTLTTAAQPNITSLGTLTGLNVNGTLSASNLTLSQLTINNPGNANSVLVLDMIAPNLPSGAGPYVEMHLGVKDNAYNTGIIQFNYAGLDSSSGNNLGLGLWNATNVLQVFTTGVVINGGSNPQPFYLNSSNYTASIEIFRMFSTALNTGNNCQFTLGVDGSYMNCGVMQFNYINSGANGFGGNNLGLGFYANNNVFQVYSSGIQVNCPDNSNTTIVTQLFTPNMPNGGNVQMLIGVNTSAPANVGIIQFNYASSGFPGNMIGSGSNLGIGLKNSNNVLQVYHSGLQINGGLTKSSGSFDIPHPDPVKQIRGYRIRHCFVESNTRGDNLYRYTITTINGKAEITLPSYFKYLNETPQMFITAADVFCFYKGRVDAEKVYIESSIDGTFNVLVIGTRKDQAARDHFDPFGEEYIQRK
jgi:hypothetical protein